MWTQIEGIINRNRINSNTVTATTMPITPTPIAATVDRLLLPLSIWAAATSATVLTFN